MGCGGAGGLRRIFTPLVRSRINISRVCVIPADSKIMPVRRQLGHRQRGRADSAGNTGENNITIQQKRKIYAERYGSAG